MSRKVLQAATRELTRAIEDLFAARKRLPGLILLYASIDIMASLDRPEAQEDVQRQDFIRWVDAYLLPHSPRIKATAWDLYGARCGLIHTYAPGSNVARRGQAREVYYVWGALAPERLDEAGKRIAWRTPSVSVHLDDLLSGLKAGINAYLRDLSSDARRARLAYARAGRFFRAGPKDHIDLFLQHSHSPESS